MLLKTFQKFLAGTLAVGIILGSSPASSRDFLPVLAEETGNDTVTVTNNANMGNVSIAIHSNWVNEDGTRSETPFFANVLPGQIVPQELSITNQAEDCWIRARLSFSSNDKHVLTEDDVHIASENWIRKTDGYWYYTKPVKRGSSVVFVDHVTIPSDWDEISSSKMFLLNCRADAVQEIHFSPEFNSNDPWFGTLVEQSVYNYTLDKTKHSDNFMVEYEGGAEGLIKLGDDWFNNWGTLMPGDSFSGSAKIANDYTSPVRLFFRMENVFPSDLGDEITLRIYRGTEKIYDGPLARNIKEMHIADMEPGTQWAFRYEIEVPSRLKNKYALTDAQVKWIFRAQPVKDVSTGVLGNNVLLSIALGAIGAGIVAVLVVRKRKQQKE